MMEQLLDMAKKVSDKAEVYSFDSEGDAISFENGRLKDIESRMQSGVSLRIIKNDVQGFAYTRNLRDREELVGNALGSLTGGVEGAFELAGSNEPAALETYDSSIETLTNAKMVEECSRVCELLSQTTTGQINVSASRSTGSLRLLNSSGSDLSSKFSRYGFHTSLLYPHTTASLSRTHRAKTFQEAPGEYLNFLSDTYNRSLKEVSPPKEKMKVIFLPETAYVLMWRLQSATSGLSIYQNISPLGRRIGEKIFDDTFTLYNNPLNDSLPGARAFDDEGTPCAFFPLIENGVLRNFYYDLYFAHKLKALPMGHGFRGSISSKPAPSLGHLAMTPGDESFADIVRSVDSGIIIGGALGAHSGNIPHGDFSIGVSPAIYVEKGEIAGNVKDVMAAGNVYGTLKQIIAIENLLHPGHGGNFPALLLDTVSVTIKK
ncbi:MAG: TldD/PmbA family protein [Nitrospirota bacterium]